MSRERSPKQKAVRTEGEMARQSCENFIQELREIEARDIIACRSDVKLALHNIVRGVNAVLAHEATIRHKLPTENIAQFRSLIELGQAIEYATRQVDRHAPPKDLKQLIARGREVRLILLTAAESLATVGIFPRHVVAKIRAGHGDIDAAGDCVELAALFAKNAAETRGKTPVTPELVREAAEVGSKLLTVLKPRRSRAPKEEQDEVRKARDVRDRLWTLLVQRHERLRRVGAYLFGVSKLESHVPSLQSGKRMAAKAKTKTTKPAAAKKTETATTTQVVAKEAETAPTKTVVKEVQTAKATEKS